jgi:hypothetical protein
MLMRVLLHKGLLKKSAAAVLAPLLPFTYSMDVPGVKLSAVWLDGPF